MHILQLITKFYRSGAESLVYDISQILVEKGYKVTILALNKNENSLEEDNIKKNLESKGIKTLCFNSQRTHVQKIRHLVYEIKENHINLIHAHAYHPNKYGRIASFFSGVPTVVTYHSATNDWVNFRARTLEKILSLSIFKQKRVSVSKIPLNHYRNKISKNKEVFIIPNGVFVDKYKEEKSLEEVRRSLGLTKSDKMLLNVGRIVEAKNQKVLIKALAKLKEKGYRDIHLFIAGLKQNEDLFKELLDISQKSNLSSNVHFLGSRNDIGNLLQACDVFMFPSLNEAHPIALIEAAFCGKVILASSIEANINSFSQESVIFLKENHVDHIVESLENIFNDFNHYSSYGLKAKSEAENKYNIYKTVEKYENLYSGLL
ncbi:glycosyltransferase family 4 protein [Priestia flexa]|uniref:Glycosyltransferase family 4 protein n=1 Tax=Priestia flexa TaxID=86664 RepID=A0ABU4J4V3_9BACI|nr:glycosyltransferase family 4 protein [Priestia flexa]MDW8516026.1 glycosyltransferase family 4 protein [Priestia flexa]